MTKLNKRKVEWIIREMKKRDTSVYQIAKKQKVTKQWIYQIYREYQETKRLPVPNPPGRKPKEIPEAEKKFILEIKKDNPVGPVKLEILLKNRGIKMPHNRIYRVLKEANLVKNQQNKQKQRKYVRYERKHSNSLWHADWFESDEHEQVLLVEDDASRFIPRIGVFNSATSENSAKISEAAFKKYIPPKQYMTDHGTQFTSLPREDCPNPKPNRFQKCLEKYNVKHIRARIKHPQTNGKVERVFQTIYAFKKHFGSWEKAVEYYNYEIFHLSLGNGKPETPYQAYLKKMRKNGQKKEIS